MTNLPNDQIDPYESRLARHVGDFAEQAVIPIDAAAIAAAAHAGAHRQSVASRLFGSSASTARLGVVLAGALVAVAAFGVYIGGGNIGPSQSSSDPDATPTAMAGAAEACSARFLLGEITAWEGAAGHRIATIDIHNDGPAPCLLPQYLRPALVDSGGSALIVGEFVPEPAPIEFPNGSDATSFVDMSNYCGDMATLPPLRIRLYLPDQSSIEVSVAANVPGPIDPPPCNGPSEPAQIHMQPLHLVAPRY